MTQCSPLSQYPLVPLGKSKDLVQTSFISILSLLELCRGPRAKNRNLPCTQDARHPVVVLKGR